MVKFRNILIMFFLSLLICAWSGESFGQTDGTDVNTNDCVGPCPAGEVMNKTPNGCICSPINDGGGDQTKANFCSSNQGLFSELVQTGQKIFYRLRDLIYVVAGFGIIAVAVGGFFGNLNWKWLGAIVISLVVIATAGELIVLMTGCEQFSSSLITNTLTNPAPMTTEEFNAKYTEEYEAKGYIDWDDSMDVLPQSSPQDVEDTAFEATMGDS